MRLIQTSHLKNWADSVAAESRFPRMLRQLVGAVIRPENLHHIRMPSDDASRVHGFDGEVFCDEENLFVPKDMSVWEISKRADIKVKANQDYSTRCEEGDPFIRGEKWKRNELTFVYATPRLWDRGDKEKWIAERKDEGIWKDIVVIDGETVQNWLEVASAVSLSFLFELGIGPEEGLQSLDEAWEEWCSLSNPPVTENLILAGRENQAKELIGLLAPTPGTFIVRTDSPRTAWGFALAALREAASDDDPQNFRDRTVVANDEIVARQLVARNNLIIVLKGTKGQVSGSLASRSCNVIVPEGMDSRSQHSVIELARPSHRSFADALRSMGLRDDEAERVARDCGLSVTILQRQRPHANYLKPEWADKSYARLLLPALLGGRWNSRNEADQVILCALANSSNYEEVEREFQGFLHVNEPPLCRVENMWSLTAPVDAFQLIARFLTDGDLARFREAFRDVFGRIDPKVEISPDERLLYGLRKEGGHSEWLRSGMAEALLLIAERGSGAGMTLLSPSDYAEEVVRGLPALNDDWRLLASIRDQYSRLMEAAPGPLLESLERLLEAKSDDIRRIFTEGKGMFSVGGMHTGLLWGLETIAWSPDYLSRVASILSRLAAIDPKGSSANRPTNSLGEIFLWWHPGTNASSEQRLEAIDLILSQEPDVGWSLLAKLLPNAGPSSCTGTAKPRWRDFGDLHEDSRTRLGQFQYISSIVDRALDCLGSDSERWQTFLHSLRALNTSQREKTLDQLTAVAQGPLTPEVKTALWEMLREFIYQHRTFHDAEWALPEDFIDRLEAILTHLSPDDPVERNRWLFDEWLPELPTGEQDISERKETLENLRQQAIQEILDVHGVDGVVSIGASCKMPGFVASAAVPLIASISVIRDLVDKALSLGEKGFLFAGLLSGQAQQFHGEEWCNIVRTDAKTGTWRPEVVALLLAWWPNTRASWEDAATLGERVAAEYWRKIQVSVMDGTPEDQTYQIDRLIEAGRAAEAFDRVAYHCERIPTDALVRLFDGTFDELARAQTPEEIRRLRLSSHDVQAILNQLRKRTDLSREELARREYRALQILGAVYAEGLTLHEFMAEDPNFFVEVLCQVFRPNHRDADVESEPSLEAKARARIGYSLLESMDRIPGQIGDTQFDEGALLEWVNAVRKKASELDRAEIADQKIGEVLAHSPLDPDDGGWPHSIIRNVLEGLASENIDLGLKIKRHNMRGVYAKSLDEGGAQERALAREYRDWADVSRNRWPRVARVLERIAKGWEEVGRSEDVDAAQRELY